MANVYSIDYDSKKANGQLASLFVAPFSPQNPAIDSSLPGEQRSQATTGERESTDNWQIPDRYVKHENLDTRRLTIMQRLHLARVHYFRPANLIRVAFISFCLAWFVINVYTVMSQYLHFDTIVYMEYQSPKVTGPPAVTLCTHCIYCSFNSTALQSVLVKNAIMYDENQVFANKTVPIHFENSGNQSNIKPDPNMTVNLHDVVEDCRLIVSTVDNGDTGQTIFNCADISRVVVSMQEGHKCFTYFSDIYGDMSRLRQQSPQKAKQIQMEFERFPRIQMQLSEKFLHGSPISRLQEIPSKVSRDSPLLPVNFDGRINAGIYIVLHSPSIFPDMLELSFHRLMPGKLTGVRFVKTIEHLKPWPYQTNCYSYDTSNSKQIATETLMGDDALTDSGLSNYRSRGECFIYCMWRVLNNGKCVNFYSIFTGDQVENEERRQEIEMLQHKLEHIVPFNRHHHNHSSSSSSSDSIHQLRFCPVDNETFIQYKNARKQCLKACKQACVMETFGIENLYDLEYTEKSYAKIEWSTEPVVFIVHQEKFTTPGFLGNIGGHAHIWLGISAVNIIIYLIHLIRSRRLITCC